MLGFIIPAAILAPILFRIRGSGIGPFLESKGIWYSKRVVKALYALLFGITGYLLGDLWTAAAGLAIYAGISMGWGSFYDLGENPHDWKRAKINKPIGWIMGVEKRDWTDDQRIQHNLISMALRSVLTHVPGTIILAYAGHDGAAFMYMYLCMAHFLGQFAGLNFTKGVPTEINIEGFVFMEARNRYEVAEIFVGFLLYAAFTAALYLGL